MAIRSPTPSPLTSPPVSRSMPFQPPVRTSPRARRGHGGIRGCRGVVAHLGIEGASAVVACRGAEVGGDQWLGDRGGEIRRIRPGALGVAVVVGHDPVVGLVPGELADRYGPL